MTALQPLLDCSTDEFERALLRSVQDELPNAEGMRAAALALGLAVPTANALAAALPAVSTVGVAHGVNATSLAGGLSTAGGAVTTSAVTTGSVAASATGAAGVATSVSVGAVVKSLLGGALVSFLALSTVERTFGGAANQAAPPALAPRSVAQPEAAAPPVTRTPTALLSPVAPADELRPATAPGVVASKRRAPSGAAAPVLAAERPATFAPPARAEFEPAAAPSAVSRAAPSSSASLAGEIHVLDQARAALEAGDSNGASRLLQAYESNRPSPVLTQEAALLQVRLLLKRGQRAAAAELARRILAQHPDSAHVDSLRQLAAEP